MDETLKAVREYDDAALDHHAVLQRGEWRRGAPSTRSSNYACLTDMETECKAFVADAFRIMRITRDHFGMEPETMARLAQMRARVYEVPISYVGRTYAEGKKSCGATAWRCSGTS